MTIEQLRELLKAAQECLHERNETMLQAQRAIEEAADDANLDELRTAFDTAAADFDETGEDVERCKRNLADAERRQRVLDDNPPPAPARARGETRDELSFRPDRHRAADFVRAAFAAQYGMDPDARELLARNNREQAGLYRDRHGIDLRDVGTGAFAGLTVPQYLLDQYAPLARAGAPLMAALGAVTRDLPEEGMEIDISRLTTGTAVAAQASENAGVQETDSDDTLLQVSIRQYAGQQDVSRQAVERSSGVVDAIFEDLFADWFTKVDSAIINADGTSGTVLGIRSTSSIISVTYTDASPTVPELYPKVADAIRQIAGNRHAPAVLILMHSSRWGWGTAALDSSNRPLFVPNANGPFNALAVGDAPEYGAVVGQMQGLPVITDNNISTTLGGGTEDVILVMRTLDYRLWLDPGRMPRRFTFEQSNAPQSVRLAVWGETAFTAGRYPKSSAVIGGTGLAAQTL